MANLSQKVLKADWKADVRCSRDLSEHQKEGFVFLLSWFENWRIARVLPADRKSAKKFWREVVLSKRRETWQLEQWGDAIAWWLRWLEYAKAEGTDIRTIQSLLGHAKVETTQIYTHVTAGVGACGVSSPLDSG